MRIAYVSREFDPLTGSTIDTYISNVTRYMALRGHEVYLITDSFADAAMHCTPVGVTIVPTAPRYADRRYISPAHEYSERVYHTLQILSEHVKFDVVEFAECGAEGFTTIRAKRMLNEFSDTKLVIKLHGPTSLTSALSEERYTDFHKTIQIYAEDYSVEHADIRLYLG
jgi:hypothetical protein